MAEHVIYFLVEPSIQLLHSVNIVAPYILIFVPAGDFISFYYEKSLLLQGMTINTQPVHVKRIRYCGMFSSKLDIDII